MQKIWKIKKEINKKEKDRQQAIINILLENRRIKREEQKEFFSSIDPKILTLQDIGIKKTNISKVLKRLEEAKKQKQKIIIYGDYDADGINATAILWETLYQLKFDVMPFLPHREKQGYGLKPNGIDAVIAKFGKPDLLITVDNGIVAFEGADYCQKLGIDLIITDHHEAIPVSHKFPENKSLKKMPTCLACLHSTQTSGAGISFLLAKEIIAKFNHIEQEDFSFLIELATIGIIADLVPLLSASRSIVKKGLELLPKTKRPGLKSLFIESGIEAQEKFSTYHIGFVIAPRLNATGRLDDPIDSLRLLCIKDQQRAIKLALDLGLTNKNRQNLTQESVDQVIQKIKTEKSKEKIIITSSQDYNPGIIGLIAGKITENFYRPSIVIAQMGEYSKGSARSVSGINIIEFLRQIETNFVDLGGHEMAAGFTVLTAKLEEVQKKLEKLAAKQFSDKYLIPSIEVETELEFTDLTLDLNKEIEKFEPFGVGNPKPVFMTKGLVIDSIVPVGRDGKHYKFLLSGEKKKIFQQANKLPVQNDANIEAIYFNVPKFVKELQIGEEVDIAYQVDLNQWNGRQKLQLLIKDIKKD
ncbi:single-stranded-DNA-specific exonuclease RecJ [Candidatus Beckwithbacteria bacterium]|nr:single-stranded-DNA-specific exonuclease RecJ [Candidatus Beckwithbacteria bacterium]